MTPQELMKAFTIAAETRNGRAMAKLFEEDGIYHDVFYGYFEGHQKIAEMVDDWFYRHASDLRWDMLNPVSDGETLYANYVFSYVSTLPEAEGKRVLFDGVSIIKLKNGRIHRYREVSNTAPALFEIGFPAGQVAKIMERQSNVLKERPETARHLQK